jgi:hypothetical protein
MARRKGGTVDAPAERSASAVLGDEIERAGDEPEPVFPDSKADPEPETPDGETPDVVYDPPPEEPALEPEKPAEERRPRVDPAIQAKNLGTALKHERDRGKKLSEELAGERAAHAASEAEAKRLRDEKARTDNRQKLEDAQDLTEALPAIKDEITAELEPGIIAARRGVIRLSQKMARRDYEDYDDVITKSGVSDMIALDPNTGKPKDPAAWRKLILLSEDPGEDAYALGLSILEGRGESPTPKTPSGGAREPALRPVIEVRPTADRFGGVRRLAASSGREQRHVTDADIEKMSEAEYGALPKHVREAYLAGGRV